MPQGRNEQTQAAIDKSILKLRRALEERARTGYFGSFSARISYRDGVPTVLTTEEEQTHKLS